MDERLLDETIDFVQKLMEEECDQYFERIETEAIKVEIFRFYGSILSIISIINHTLLSTIRAVIGTLTCTSMASNSTSNSECY